MKIKWTSTLGNFDKAKFLTEVQAHLKSVMLKGARLFLLAAIPKVPVYTGFVRSAFKNLEDLAGRVSFDRKSKKYKVVSGRQGGTREIKSRDRYQGVLKTTQSGRQFATPSNQILNIDGAKLASGRTSFYFKFEVNISYFDLLDRSIWKSFEAGTQAMDKYVKENIGKGFPQVGKFLTRKTT